MGDGNVADVERLENPHYRHIIVGTNRSNTPVYDYIINVNIQEDSENVKIQKNPSNQATRL